MFATKAHIDKGENLLNSNVSLTCPHNMVKLRLRSVGEFAAPQQISTGFASWLRYCTGVAQRRSTKLCTMFVRLSCDGTLYIQYILGGC